MLFEEGEEIRLVLAGIENIGLRDGPYSTVTELIPTDDIIITFIKY